MKTNFLLFFFIAIFIGSVYGQVSPAVKEALASKTPLELRIDMANTISSKDLQKHLNILASDEYEGRETGAPGNEKAAAYLAGVFANLGLVRVDKEQSYYQRIDMSSVRWEKIDFTINGQEFRHLWDFYAMHEGNAGVDEIKTDEIVFVGYGIQDDKLDNYKNTNVAGKTILMYGGEPRGEDGMSKLTGDKDGSEWTTNPAMKINLAKEKGAKTVFVIAEQFKQQIAKNRRFLIGPNVKLQPLNSSTKEEAIEDFQYIIISPEMAKVLVGKKIKKVKKTRIKNSKGKSTKGVRIKADVFGHMIKRKKSQQTANIIGVIPGKDPIKKDEYIVVTAHFDHLGMRGEDIFNGADDNGSGTSAVLEIAQAFSIAKSLDLGPDRSIIFLLVSGEEKGLLGSKFYTDHPLIPLENTIANVNIDMVGRVDDKHEDPNYIYVIGADRLSTTLHEVNEDVNRRFENLELDYTYNDEADPNRYYYRSDHYNFAVKGIPAVFFFNGTHADYHRPTDTVDKINFDKMSIIGRHIFHLIWELGNREEAIKVNVK